MAAREYRLSRNHPFDPPELLRELRQLPMSKVTLEDGAEVWLVTRHEDVVAVLRDSRFSSHEGYNNFTSAATKELAAWQYTSSFGHMDGAGHARIRQTLTEGFLPKRIDAMRPALEQIANTCVDRLLKLEPPADLHKTFSLAVAGQAVSVVLEMPAAYRRAIDDYMNVLIPLQESSSTALKKSYTAKLISLYHLCEQLLREHQETRETLFAQIQSAVREGQLSEHEACAAITSLTAIGHPTMASSITLSTLMLLLNQDLSRAVRDKNDTARTATEELLRYHNPMNWGIPRTATEDVSIGGVTIRKGDRVMVSLTSANRDESTLSHPNEFDINRSDARQHVTFGSGPHICLGQWLARAEVEVATSALLTRIPTLRLAVSLEELSFTEDTYVFSVKRLPVTWAHSLAGVPSDNSMIQR